MILLENFVYPIKKQIEIHRVLIIVVRTRFASYHQSNNKSKREHIDFLEVRLIILIL